jgi:hypothetical protein
MLVYDMDMRQDANLRDVVEEELLQVEPNASSLVIYSTGIDMEKAFFANHVLDLYVYFLVFRFFQNVVDCMVYAVGYSTHASYNVAEALGKEHRLLRKLTW